MNQKYKFKSLEIVKNGQEKTKETKIEDSNTLTVFETGETRTIDFIQKDGTRQNFAYSHYITAWLDKDGNDRMIKIFFATHLVTIKGFCLDQIYNALTTLTAKSIRANDARYLNNFEENRAYVKDIIVTWKKEN